jgi:hypothetical protein
MNEKENTVRILKEERLLVTGFWCRFGLHNWTKWSTPYRASIYLIQEKTCGCCGLVRHRKVMAP